jgi:hypothetical protein
MGEKERYALEVICSRCGSVGTISKFEEVSELSYNETGPTMYNKPGSIDIQATVKKFGWTYHGDDPLCPVCANGLATFLAGGSV